MNLEMIITKLLCNYGNGINYYQKMIKRGIIDITIQLIKGAFIFPVIFLGQVREDQDMKYYILKLKNQSGFPQQVGEYLRKKICLL
ncbi:hypothetical protein BMS3Abin03_02238 [bacterium BMS3Abin03]|nr:hypothetical protein BMS3Abin03_02238 [bacterium BMS3Abin03]